jgi:hypothetical protein
MTDLSGVVRQGMRLLGRKKVARLDPDMLDMSHAEDCVLGQLYGTYADGLWELSRGSSALMVQCGFTLPQSLLENASSRERKALWASLTLAWAKAIRIVQEEDDV